MTLTATDLAALATLVLACIVMAAKDDTRAWQWIKEQWRQLTEANR